MIRKAYADTPGGQIHYRHVAGDGTPVLLFHRTPVWSSSFDGVMTELAGWHPLYAFDTPGFGESLVPPVGARINDYRDWFIAAFDALGIADFHLYGHHTGSHFAIEIAAHLPTRTRSLIVDGAMYHSSAERAATRARRTPTPPIDEDGVYVRQGWDFLKPFYPRFVAATIHQEFVGAMRSLPTRETCIAALLDQDYAAVLARAACPVLACAAEDDVYAPLLARIATDLPHVATRTYGAAGIAGPELRTRELAALLRDFVTSAEANG